MRRLLYASGMALFLTSLCSAQEVPRYTFNVGAGFTNPVGTTGRNLDIGWNVGAGGGINFNSHLGAMLDFNFNRLGVNSNALQSVGFPDGNVRMWSLTVDPIVHLFPRRSVDVYLIGGGGLYQRTTEFTVPGVATGTAFNPFFGFYPAAVPVNVVASSSTINKPGVNAGMGFTFGRKGRMQFYGEARYHRMLTGDYLHTDMLPVTFGVRF
jgi:hypothetical protein